MRHMITRRSQQGSLLLQKGSGTLKSVLAEQRTLPYLSLMQVIYLSPSYWSGQGAHSSWLDNLKQIVTERRGKEEGGHRKAFQQNGVIKISFDRKDIMLLSTLWCTCPRPAVLEWSREGFPGALRAKSVSQQCPTSYLTFLFILSLAYCSDLWAYDTFTPGPMNAGVAS